MLLKLITMQLMHSIPCICKNHLNLPIVFPNGYFLSIYQLKVCILVLPPLTHYAHLSTITTTSTTTAAANTTTTTTTTTTSTTTTSTTLKVQLKQHASYHCSDPSPSSYCAGSWSYTHLHLGCVQGAQCAHRHLFRHGGQMWWSDHEHDHQSSCDGSSATHSDSLVSDMNLCLPFDISGYTVC